MKTKVILLETKDRSSIWSNKGRRLYYNQANFNDPDDEIRYNIYLIDETAEIKKDDYYIENNKIEEDFGEHRLAKLIKEKSDCKKIIASTDISLKIEHKCSNCNGTGLQPCSYTVTRFKKCTNSDCKLDTYTDKLPLLSEQSIKLLIDYYNKNGKMPESVEIECIEGFYEGVYDIIKLNSQGTVDISIPEDRMYTKDEVIELCKSSWNAGKQYSIDLWNGYSKKEDFSIWWRKIST